MENASKAVLIAGAIIVAMAVISISVVIYFNVKDAMSNISIDATSVSTHNSRFVSYIGEVTGSQVKICISNVLANNYNENTTTDYKIEISITDSRLNASNTSVTTDKIDYIKYESTDTQKAGNGKQAVCDKMSDYIKTNNLYLGSVTYNEKGIITKIDFTRQ